MLWIWIHMDPHLLTCPWSGSVLRMQIRTQEHGNWTKLQIHLVSCLRVFCTFVCMFFELKCIYHQTILLCYFRILESDQDPAGSKWIIIGLAPWIRIQILHWNQCGSTQHCSCICHFYNGGIVPVPGGKTSFCVFLLFFTLLDHTGTAICRELQEKTAFSLSF